MQTGRRVGSGRGGKGGSRKEPAGNEALRARQVAFAVSAILSAARSKSDCQGQSCRACAQLKLAFLAPLREKTRDAVP